MNQTKKRLHIIKLAISITDIDCIQHQILKLSQLKSDTKLQEILEMLQAKNYAQAQGLITTYIDTPIEEIIQRTAPQDEEAEETQAKMLREIKESAVIEAFDLFTEPEDEQAITELENIEAFLGEEPSPAKTYDNDINYDSLLSLGADDILPDNIDIDLSAPKEDTFFQEDSLHLQERDEEKDPFFDNEILAQERAPSEEDRLTQLLQKEQQQTQNDTAIPATEDLSIDEQRETYAPISYIEEKFGNLLTQYPPIEQNLQNEASVNELLQKIKTERFTEEEIEEIIGTLLTLKQEGKKGEAAKLLLLCAATPSLYAQFMLARALFRGEILQKNIPEAFSIIYRLANDENYPEAVCDLAQLYEYGIGVEKDIRKAEALYSEAAEMGIKRAQNHVTRIRKENKGLFSRFKK